MHRFMLYQVSSPNSVDIPCYIQPHHTHTCKFTGLSFQHIGTSHFYSLCQDRSMCSAFFLNQKDACLHHWLNPKFLLVERQTKTSCFGEPIECNFLFCMSQHRCCNTIKICTSLVLLTWKISTPAITISFHTCRLLASDQAVTSVTHWRIDLCVYMTLSLSCFDFISSKLFLSLFQLPANPGSQN